MRPTLVLTLVCSLLIVALCWRGNRRVMAQPPAAAPQTNGQNAPDHDKSFWMEKKLKLSQEVFAGLAEGDLEAIIVSAQAMSALNRIESFTRGRFPGYRDQLRAFTAANRELIEQAGRGNLEGTTLAFTQLTFSCVKCHQRLRDGADQGEPLEAE